MLLSKAVNVCGMLLTALSDVDVEEIAQGDASGGSLGELATSVNELGNGSMGIVYRIGVFAIAIFLMVAGIKLIAASGMGRSDAKVHVLYIIAGAILIFAAAGGGLLTLLQSIGGGIF